MFEAVILAGGFGTRLKTISGDLPKPMVDVAGAPFLYRLMRKLEACGCDRIVLSLGYRADYIIDSVTRDQPVDCTVDFSVETVPLGTGGAIKKAATYIGADKFVVLNGDSFSDIDYAKFYGASVNTDLLISGVVVDEVSRYGSLELTSDNKVTALVEKGRTGKGIINSGIYVVTKQDIVSKEKDVFSFEEDFVQGYSGRFYAFVTDGYFVDIGIPGDYHAACAYFG